MPGLKSTSPEDPYLLEQAQLPAEQSCPRKAGKLPPGLTPWANQGAAN